jgi:hypothetical protein
MAANRREPAAEPPRPNFVQRYALSAPAQAPAAPDASNRLTSPVSAYAPARYDAPAGFMSGRGLY